MLMEARNVRRQDEIAHTLVQLPKREDGVDNEIARIVIHVHLRPEIPSLRVRNAGSHRDEIAFVDREAPDGILTLGSNEIFLYFLTIQMRTRIGFTCVRLQQSRTRLVSLKS